MDYVKAHWLVYLIAVVLMIASNVDQTLIPRVLGQLTDQLQRGDISRSAVIGYSISLLIIGVSYGILFGVGQFMVARLGRKFEFYTRQKLFLKFSELSEHYFSKQGIGKLLSYVMNDVTAVRESISNGVNQTTNAIFLILSCIVMMMLSSIPLYVILICVLPVAVIPFLVIYFGPLIRDRSMKVQESLAAMTESAEEQFGAIRVTKTFAAEDIASSRYGETVDRIRDAQLKLVRMSSLFQAMLPFLGAVSLIISILAGGYLTLHRSITLGDFVALTLYLRLIVGPLQQIGNVINMMQRSRVSLERINQLLSVTPQIQEAQDALKITQINNIRIHHLSFAYPDSTDEALHDVDFTIEAGTTVGIAGRTGSGKTTLMKLLLRIYEPPRGAIFINGTDILDVSLESLRTQLAYVPQDGFLFSTTIGDNIAFSNRQASAEDLEWSAKQAVIWESIRHFPDQFETKLGERGVTLSGGQRQRTSLARGLIKKAAVLILDDSVSAVDAQTETGILESLRRERMHKTNIVISHRISTLKHSAEIIVLDEGRIVQRGTHEKLLEQGGVYESMYRLQEEGLQYG